MPNPIHQFFKHVPKGLSFKQKCLFALLTLVYVISPIDVIPDMLVLVGQLDDLAAIVVMIAALLSPSRRPPSSGDAVYVRVSPVRPRGGAA